MLTKDVHKTGNNHPILRRTCVVVGRTQYALLMHSRCIKCFCEGAKTLLFKGKR